MGKAFAELGEIQRQIPGRTIPLILEAAVEELAMVSIQDFQEVRGARQKRERDRENKIEREIEIERESKHLGP